MWSGIGLLFRLHPMMASVDAVPRTKNQLASGVTRAIILSNAKEVGFAAILATIDLVAVVGFIRAGFPTDERYLPQAGPGLVAQPRDPGASPESR